MADDKDGPSLINRTAVVSPLPEPDEEGSSLYPVIPLSDLPEEHSTNDDATLANGVKKPRRLPHMDLPSAPRNNDHHEHESPHLDLSNISLPHMININSYIPNFKPPTFLKEIYSLPVQVSDHINHEVHKVGSNINKLIDRSEVYLSKPPPMPEYDNCSIFSTLFSMFNYIFNTTSNIGAAYVLWFEPDSTWWFWLTVILMVIPTVVVNGFSLFWYWERHQAARKKDSAPKRPRITKCWWILRILMHLLLLGPFFRYFDTLYYGIKSRKSKLQRINIMGPYCPWPKQRKELKRQGEYYYLLLQEERDQSILEIMNSFMLDASQLVLQIYILAKRPPENKNESDYIFTVLVQILSLLTSLFNMAWSLTSYQRALRYAMTDKPNLSLGGAVSIFWWQALTIVARVVALALFATSFKLEVFLFLISHWTLMTIWILAQKTNFCADENGRRRPLQEFFYDLVMGWVYVFTMINVKGSPTRWKFTAYYLLLFAENATLIILWYLKPENGPHWYHIPALVGTWMGFFLGLSFMILYYKKYHPDLVDGKMPKKDEPAKLI